MKFLKVLILLSGISFFTSACYEVPDKAIVGISAPDFSLQDRQGNTWMLSELKGQVVFINFWATWCPPCREEMPSMQRLYDRLPKDKFKMLAILSRDKPEAADKFAAKHRITLPILYDQDNTAGPKYGLTGLPETFIVDKYGILRNKYIGPAQWDSPEFEQLIRKYIAE